MLRRPCPTPLLGLLVLGAASLFPACASRTPAPAAVSLDGRPLAPLPLPAPVEEWLQAEVDTALRAWRIDPSEQRAIWVGRRLAYRGYYAEALAWYTGALETFPDSYRLRRHLGHRLLTLRQVGAARAVLEEARALAADAPNRLEPDGAPSPSGEPRSTTHGNIDYHLGLAAYLCGDFAEAARSFDACLHVWGRNADAHVAALHWLVMCALQQGDDDLARLLAQTGIDEDDVIENFAYLELLRLYRGGTTLDALLADEDPSAAVRYGAARWALAFGQEERGNALLEGLLADEGWTSFGVLAAEADRARAAGIDVCVLPAPPDAEAPSAGSTEAAGAD